MCVCVSMQCMSSLKHKVNLKLNLPPGRFNLRLNLVLEKLVFLQEISLLNSGLN